MKNVYILIIALALLIGLYFLVRTPSLSSFNPASDFSIPDTSEITQIELMEYAKREKRKEVRLKKQAEGNWIANEKYPVQKGKISNLLKVMHQLEVRETLKDAGQKTAMELMNQNHILVTVSGNKGHIKSYMIGPTNPKQSGNVMLMKGGDIPVVMTRPGAQIGYLYNYYSPELNEWRDNILFSADSASLKSVSINYYGSSASFSISRNSPAEKMQLLGEKGIQENLDAYLGLFRGNLNAETFADARYPGYLDSLKNRQADIVFQLESFEKPPTRIYLYLRPENLENYFARIEGQNELLTAQQYVLGKFLVKRDYFLVPFQKTNPS